MLNFSETIEPSEILRMLSRSIPYYLKSWCDFDETTGLFGTVDPKSFNMRSIGSSSPVIEYVVRPHLNILCLFGAFLHRNNCDLIDAIISREELAARIRKGLQWVCETHLTGTRDVATFLGRKRWGENWRSSMWATQLGICKFFCSSLLPAELAARIDEIIAFEADRFISLLPPSGCAHDTKAEENAQDAMLLAWAVNLCPGHPHREAWERTLQVWSVNIASCILDKSDHGPFLDGSLSGAITTANLFPDMTAENHGFFHPEALSYSAWVVLAMAAYALHNRVPPEVMLRKNHQRTFELLLRFGLPSGMIYAPGSNDFPLFTPRPLVYAWGLWNNSPRAQTLTSRLLSWMDTCLLATQENQGPWVFGLGQDHDGWELLFQSNVGFELAMLACLPFSGDHPRAAGGPQTENVVDTRHIYPYVEVCYRRNIRTTRSVAWKALGGHPMIGFCVHSQPELLVPVKAGFLGVPQTGDHVSSWDVAFHTDRIVRDGFDTWGRIRYYNNAGSQILHRDLRVLTWGDEGMLVFDEITADTALAVHEQYLSPVFLVNDHWTGDALDFYSGSLLETFRASERKYRAVQCPSFWASIGTHLLFQFVWGRTKGLYYLPGGERNAPPLWKNCRLDTLAIHVEPHDASSGAVIYRVGFYIGTGKSPRPFKAAGTAGEFFKGLVIMDGKMTAGLD
jgi:hypothetical protein